MQHPSVTNERELNRFAWAVALTCLALAMAVDLVNELVFYVDLPTFLRGWGVTAALTLGLAYPFSRWTGRAHLELYRAKRVAEELSRTDPLTGLLNRRAMMDAVPRFARSTFALVIVDIDRFKIVNDTYGHVVGDDVLCAVAQRMADELSGLGLLARVGGEEFALLSSEMPVDRLMERLSALRRRIASTPIMSKGLAVRVTISAGVAVAQNNEGFDQLYSAADQAVYSAKAAGRNRIILAKGTIVALTEVGDDEAVLDGARPTGPPKLSLAK